MFFLRRLSVRTHVPQRTVSSTAALQRSHHFNDEFDNPHNSNSFNSSSSSSNHSTNGNNNNSNSHSHSDSSTAGPSAGSLGGMSREVFTHLVEEMAPFVKNVVKINVVSVSAHELHVTLPFHKNLVGNIAVPCLHGGVVASVIDHVGGFCSWANLEDPFLRVNTADLRVDYLSPAPCEELHIIAHVVHRSKRLIRTDVVVWNQARNKKIAIGRTLFNVYREGFNIQEVMANLIAETKRMKAAGIDLDEEAL